MSSINELSPPALGDSSQLSGQPFHYDDAISRGEVQPIILFGAPRSGTQMFRDMICGHPKVATWPYNEMTYMWRYGNRDHRTDELPVEMLTEKTAHYIRGCFIKLARKSGSPLVLDKTCHNCLRPDFVAAVLPEAKYIYLIRHGMDVVPSTLKRSESAPPWREYFRIFSIPVADIPYTIGQAVWNHGGLLRPGKRTVRAWGPKFEGMEELLKTKSRAEVSAFQWLRHIELTDRFLGDERFKSPLLRVRYENITSNPATELKRTFDYLGVNTPEDLVKEWIPQMRHSEPGSGASKLGEAEAKVRSIVKEKNQEHGYNLS